MSFPERYKEQLYQYTVEFIVLILKSFEKSKLHEVRKVKKLLNSFHNLSKNEITRRLKIKNISSSDQDFLLDFQKNDVAGSQQKDPEATYQNVVIANTIYYLVLNKCMKFDSSLDSSYDLKQITRMGN